ALRPHADEELAAVAEQVHRVDGDGPSEPLDPEHRRVRDLPEPFECRLSVLTGEPTPRERGKRRRPEGGPQEGAAREPHGCRPPASCPRPGGRAVLCGISHPRG